MLIDIPKDQQEEYFKELTRVFKSGFLSEGKALLEFEKQFGKSVNLLTAGVANGGLALQAILESCDLKGKEVIVPTNTFMATPLAVERAGAKVVFADCNKYDLCLSAEDLRKRVTKRTKAIVVVHIGGHIAFDIFEIKKFCEKNNIFLIEDCAHAHGASFKGKTAGSFGLAGAYSFYATKTMTTGEGGMVVSRYRKVIDYLKKARNYGKYDYKIKGFNYRMNEVTAALGIVQLKYLPEILRWKRKLAVKYDKIFSDRVRLPKDMISGYYKYVVFNLKLKEETGTVYNQLCHEIMKVKGEFPNSQWIKAHHACPPIYYGWEGWKLDISGLSRRLIEKG